MIDYQKLYQKGFRGIIFDIDNTLVHHGDDSTPEIDDLFRKIQRLGLKTLLLSNNDRGRVERFIKNIDTPYICDADKPNPQNYLKAVEMLNIKKEEAVVIGDQVFTDILGANRSGLASILVRFIRQDDEKWIGKRRYVEYAILECWKRDKSCYRRIGDIYTEGTAKNMKKKKEKKLFCEICPLTYEISKSKEVCKRNRSRASEKQGKKHSPCILQDKWDDHSSWRDFFVLEDCRENIKEEGLPGWSYYYRR